MKIHEEVYMNMSLRCARVEQVIYLACGTPNPSRKG
jgi:hypothetical protein